MEYLCIGVFILAMVGAAYHLTTGDPRLEAARKEYRARREAARKGYVAGLEKLKSDPTNAEVRQHTLAYGREWCELLRQSGDYSYDELALKNDIDAACAGAVSVSQSSIEQRLHRLQQLLTSGLISDEEYSRRRQAIIDEV